MSMKTVKRLAKRIMGVGLSRVRIADAAQVREALTTEDVRQLVAKKVIYALPEQGVGRGKAQTKSDRKKAGRRRGMGSARGTFKATLTDKDRWMLLVRGQRKLLSGFKGQLTTGDFRKIYRMVKGSAFRSRKTLLAFITKTMAQTKVAAVK